MHTRNSSILVDLRQTILLIARTLNYVGASGYNHAFRVAYIAHECSKKLGWSDDEQELVFLSGLLHDCGVSSNAEHQNLLKTFDVSQEQLHCVIGYEQLLKCDLLDIFAIPVRYHHQRWDDFDEIEISEGDKNAANLIQLADRVDQLRMKFSADKNPDLIVLQKDNIIEQISSHKGTHFNPEFVDAFVELAHQDGFWYSMDPELIETMGMGLGTDGNYRVLLDIKTTENLAEFLANIVDAKCSFTYHHSERLAKLATALAREFEYNQEDISLINIAALLHDIGKIKVPNESLNKPGKLTPEEYAVIKKHVVDTRLSLHRCFLNSPIVDWAANHHERLDGSGYPFCLKADQIDLPSRIIAVSDVFQALAQNRPYRGRLKIDEILAIIEPMGEGNKLAPEVLEKIYQKKDYYYQIAIGEIEG